MKPSYNQLVALHCTCDHHAPCERLLRAPGFNRTLAAYWLGWNVSVPVVYDQVLSELYDHAGALFDLNGERIDLYAVDQNGDDWIDRAFACGDIYRTLHRYLERANGGFRNRLDRSLIRPVLAMHFAREIAECATVGACAKRERSSAKSAD